MSPLRSDSRRPRRGGVGLLIITMGLLCFSIGLRTAEAQDRAANWLEERGMFELLQLHLEEARTNAAGDAALRGRLATRLASVYASLIEREQDDERRAVLVARARRLLADNTIEDAEALRLTLLRTRYRSASSIVEKGRVDLADANAIKTAEGELESLARDLEILSRDLESVIRRSDRGLDRATGIRVRQLDKEIESSRKMQLASALLEGWSLYYAGRARGDSDRLGRAQLAFGQVLQGDEPVPGPGDISLDRQEFEYFASAVLGMAMTSAQLVSHRGAGPWFDRLKSLRTHPAILAAVPGWRLASAIDAEEFDSAEDQLRSLIGLSQKGDENDVLPAAWLRLAAVGGLRASEDVTQASSAAAGRLAELALATLAARSELAQVVDLAERYGLDAVGRDGFAFRYVRGVGQYREAVEARTAGRLTDAATGFAAAADELGAAVDESDAARFPEARAACLSLAGWSLLEVGRPADAADAFEAAADRTGGPRRADAMWGAIVSLDQLVVDGGPEAADAQARRDDLIERFLDGFPADDRAPSLVVRRITGRDDPSGGDLNVLLAVPKGHPTWEIARRRGAQAIYQQFREASVGGRSELGTSFLEVADELLSRDRNEDGMFVDLRGADGVLLRQAAEVASHEEVGDRDRGARYFAQIELAMERGGFDDLPDLPNELEYRRLGMAIATDDFEDAMIRLDRLPVVADSPEAVRWSRLGAQRLHRAAFLRMRNGDASLSVVRSAVGAGERFIALVAGTETSIEDALEDHALLPVAASVAAARQAIYNADGDEENGRRALELYKSILVKRPRDGSVLEAGGDLGSRLGDVEFSLECWRKLGSAAASGSDVWWKARCGLIGVLAETDPDRARAVLEQIRALHPELGPPTFRATLQELDIRLATDLIRSGDEDPQGEASEGQEGQQGEEGEEGEAREEGNQEDEDAPPPGSPESEDVEGGNS
jgi:tetratricopeptide (TPR) repeat protein